MKPLATVAIAVVLSATFGSVCHSSCSQDKEDVFVIKNYYQNRVFADGKEARSFVIDSATIIYGFCIPREAKLLAVTNTFDLLSPVSFFGSLEERLLTNEEWKCVNDERSADWYQPRYNDTSWPQAFSRKPLTNSPFISEKAQAISSVQNTSNKYYCRGRIKERAYVEKQLRRSAFAAKIESDRRLVNHVIQSFLVLDILECLSHCLEFDQCVSLNFEQSSKTCNLNNGTNTRYLQDMEKRNGFDYYKIIKP